MQIVINFHVILLFAVIKALNNKLPLLVVEFD